jgi:hypothetical protein
VIDLNSRGSFQFSYVFERYQEMSVSFKISASCVARLVLVASLPALVSTAAVADEGEEEHFDIGVWNNGGVLTTGGWDHDTESLEVANLRVYEAHFGELPGFPDSIDEPGIGGVAADLGLPEGATLSLNMLSGLRIWNGDGFDSIFNSTMFVDYGPASMNSQSGGFIDFLISDDYDLHPIYSIESGSDTGSYLLEFNVSMAGFETSDSFWIAFNYGMDDEDFEASVEWVEGNLVPAPGGVVLLAMAALGAGRRRRD